MGGTGGGGVVGRGRSASTASVQPQAQQQPRLQHQGFSKALPLPQPKAHENGTPNPGARLNPTLNLNLNLNPSRLGSLTPTNPFSPAVSRNASPSPGPGQGSGFSTGLKSADSSLSLSVNYLPNKFSSGALGIGGRGYGYGYTRAGGEGVRRRSNGPRGTGLGGLGVGLGAGIPKMGGGSDAFRSGESRIGGHGEYEDDDGDEGRGLLKSWGYAGKGNGNGRGRGGRGKKLRWNKFKWALFVANVVLTIYTLSTLITCILYWLSVPPHASIITTGNHTELAISTLASLLGVLTAMIGFSGIILNDRRFLAIYTFMLWIVFTLMLVPGYMTYKRRTFNLEGKLNAQWSRDLGMRGRLVIQNSLRCCGYFSPFIEATVSQTCYARSTLVGCKAPYITFERRALEKWYSVVFGLVPVQLGVMVTALLCSNHVTYRFGKGMMPERYRLSEGVVGVIMERYAEQLAEQYGSDIASSMMRRAPTPLSNNPGYNYDTTGSGAGYMYNALEDMGGTSGMSTPMGGLEVLGYEGTSEGRRGRRRREGMI
ncbi:hypothetical protein BJ165DRAFT_1340331 [Panaeolus papilionaceus]|nr:hypothetical protein BJ165DRAFT_1340331 [Panaeolus papilionaceus]